MTKKIQDYVNDDMMDLEVLLKSATARVAKNGKQFLALTFQDETGQIDGMYWDASVEDVQMYTSGKAVHLKGKRTAYQNKPQVEIQSLQLLDQQDANVLARFVPGAPLNAQEMQAQLSQLVFEITQPNWQRIVRHLLQEHQQSFFTFPAAKTNHHAYMGGIAFHTLSMANIAKSLCQQYPQINQSLLLAGVILHDLGKVFELSGPIGTEYTVSGNLIGHIVLIDEQIIQACKTLKIDEQAEDMLVLRHLILAHHGLLEYGSPTRPKVMEAEILHQIDELDASITMMTNTLAKTEVGQFSERVFAMDNRQFYRYQ